MLYFVDFFNSSSFFFFFDEVVGTNFCHNIIFWKRKKLNENIITSKIERFSKAHNLVQITSLSHSTSGFLYVFTGT
jgi:hypothetical protein